jgi:short-subunit dehydrogenase
MALKSVILTGASDGIGKAVAYEFARRGFALGLLARREELLLEVKAECEKLGSPQVLIEVCDVSNEEHFEKTLLKLDDAFSGADIFIANAGVTGRTSFAPDAWKQVKHTLTINVMAAIHGLEVMKLRMIARNKGILCGVSSVAGARGMPTAGAYSTSKAALTTYLESMRIDLLPYGVSVVTIAPGFIDTPMTKLNKGTMPFITTPEKAARIFVNGIIAKKRWIVAPRPYRFLYPILQMLPRSLFDFILKRAYASIRDAH